MLILALFSASPTPLKWKTVNRSTPQVYAPNEATPVATVHAGWGKSKRKMDTAGAARSEAARLYRKCAAGEITPEDLTKGIYALEKIAKLSEQAALEAKIDRLERLLKEALA